MHCLLRVEQQLSHSALCCAPGEPKRTSRSARYFSFFFSISSAASGLCGPACPGLRSINVDFSLLGVTNGLDAQRTSIVTKQGNNYSDHSRFRVQQKLAGTTLLRCEPSRDVRWRAGPLHELLLAPPYPAASWARPLWQRWLESWRQTALAAARAHLAPADADPCTTTLRAASLGAVL